MKRTKKAFTLVELLVVIAILGILGGISVVGYTGFKTVAEKQAACETLTEVKTHLQLEDADCDAYEITTEGISFNTTKAPLSSLSETDKADNSKCLQAILNSFKTETPDDWDEVTITNFVMDGKKIVFNYSDSVHGEWDTTGNKVEGVKVSK